MNARDHNSLVAKTMAELTRHFYGPTTISDTLHQVTASAVELIVGVDCADILLIDDGEGDAFHSVAATSELPVSMDIAQQFHGEGPCLDAARTDTVVRVDDLREDPRWPKFSVVAVESGVHAMLSYRLYIRGSQTGALNLFGFEPDAFDFESEAVGALLATHAAIALIAENKEIQFHSALASRDTIGQAKGMIMERFDVDAVRAFELLAALSQDSNTPLARVAGNIIAQGPATR